MSSVSTNDVDENDALGGFGAEQFLGLVDETSPSGFEGVLLVDGLPNLVEEGALGKDTYSTL